MENGLSLLSLGFPRVLFSQVQVDQSKSAALWKTKSTVKLYGWLAF